MNSPTDISSFVTTKHKIRLDSAHNSYFYSYIFSYQHTCIDGSTYNELLIPSDDIALLLGENILDIDTKPVGYIFFYHDGEIVEQELSRVSDASQMLLTALYRGNLDSRAAVLHLVTSLLRQDSICKKFNSKKNRPVEYPFVSYDCFDEYEEFDLPNFLDEAEEEIEVESALPSDSHIVSRKIAYNQNTTDVLDMLIP